MLEKIKLGINKLFTYYRRPIICDECMWFIPERYPLLIKINLATAVVCDIINIPVNKLYEGGYRGYRNIEKIGRKLYLLPFAHNELVSDIIGFDIDRKLFRNISIPNGLLREDEILYKNDPGCVFYISLSHGKNIYLPSYAPVILKFDTIDGKITAHRQWKHNLFLDQHIDSFFVLDGNIEENGIIFPIYHTKYLVKFDVDLAKYQVYKIDNPDDDIENVFFVDDFYWIISNKQHRIIRWDKKSFQEIATINDDLCSIKDCVEVKNELWFFPYQSSMAICLRPEQKNKLQINTEIPCLPKQKLRNIFQANYPGLSCHHNNIVYNVNPDMELLVAINKATGEIIAKKINLPESLLKKCWSVLTDWQYCFDSNGIYNGIFRETDFLINNISALSKIWHMNVVPNNKCGEYIYKNII